MCVIQKKQGDKCETRTRIMCFGHVELSSSVMLYLSYKCDFYFLLISQKKSEVRREKGTWMKKGRKMMTIESLL